jgi:hypothetical protein
MLIYARPDAWKGASFPPCIKFEVNSSGNPQSHWIPGQARNDKLNKTYDVLYNNNIAPQRMVVTIPFQDAMGSLKTPRAWSSEKIQDQRKRGVMPKRKHSS